MYLKTASVAKPSSPPQLVHPQCLIVDHKYAKHSSKLPDMRLRHQAHLHRCTWCIHCTATRERNCANALSVHKVWQGVTGSTTMHPTPKMLSNCNPPQQHMHAPKTELNQFLGLSSSVLVSAANAGVTFCPPVRAYTW